MNTRGKRNLLGVGPVETPAEEPVPTEELVEGLIQTPVGEFGEPEPMVSIPSDPVAEAMRPQEPTQPEISVPSMRSDVFAVLSDAQAVMAKGMEALSNEMAGLARSEIDAAARRATAMLGAKTFFDLVEVNAGFVRGALDRWTESAARLSELGAKFAAEASQPLLGRVRGGWASPPRFAP